MRSRRGWTALLVAATSLVCLGSALYQESFVHTDDGCEVETHCLACRLAVASAPEAPAPPDAVHPPARVTGLATADADSETLDRVARLAQPRAPPAA